MSEHHERFQNLAGSIRCFVVVPVGKWYMFYRKKFRETFLCCELKIDDRKSVFYLPTYVFVCNDLLGGKRNKHDSDRCFTS